MIVLSEAMKCKSMIHILHKITLPLSLNVIFNYSGICVEAIIFSKCNNVEPFLFFVIF